jgi:MSHA biogenesis protein MshP
MFRRVENLHASKKQRGSALVIAVFIIVVMTVLGVALVRMLGASSESVAYEVIGTRAYAMAQTGVQWAGGKVFPLNSGALHCDGTTPVANSGNDFTSSSIFSPPSSISNNDGLNGCQISSLTCNDLKYDDVVYFTISSTGRCDVGGVITSRTIVIEARSL